MSMIITLIPQIAAAGIATGAIIYAATAKRKVPITPKEADIIWKLHKKNAKCTSHKMQPWITKHGEITGFLCQCGYKFTQQRPLMSRAPQLNSQTAKNSLRKTETSAKPLSKIASRT